MSFRKELIKKLLGTIEENPNREGLLRTPDRVDRSYAEMFQGYKLEEKDIFKATFEDGACNEMVVLKNIRGFSHCEHHIIPFRYVAHIGYIPNGKVIGVSKLARLVNMYGSRLQIQEKMTTQIADSLNKNLNPKGCMVVISGQHLCMQARGVKQHDSTMITSAVRGVFKENIETKNEFLSLIKMI